MNKTQYTVLALAATAVFVGIYSFFSKNATLDHLYARYPDLDHEVAKKAYKKMMRDALSGKLNCDNWSEERFDQQFVQEYNAMKNHK
jgi:hypothetical protein